MKFLVASQVATAAFESATPGGTIFNRTKLRQQDDSTPPSAPDLSVSTPTHQANEALPNRHSSRIQGLDAPLHLAPGLSGSKVVSIAKTIPAKLRTLGQYTQEEIRVS